MNVEFCSVAVSQRVVAVAEDAPFECPKCGEPLQEAGVARSKARSKVFLALQVFVLLLGGAAIAYKLAGGFNSGLVSRPAEEASGQSAIGPVAANAATSMPAAPPPAAPVPAAAALPAVQPPAPGPVQVADQTAVAAAAPPPAAPAPGPAFAPPPPAASPAPVAQVPAPAPAAEAPKVASTELFRLAGSDVIGNRLARRLASGYLGLIGDTSITLTPAKADGTVEVAGIQTGERELVAIVSNSSTAGFNAMLRGSADFVMSARKITPAEAERLASLGDMTKPASEHVIALQGLAAVVNPANKLSSLTMAQLRSVLSGGALDWSEVGGAPGRINVYVTGNRTGTADEPHDFVLGQGGAALSPAARSVPSEQALSSAVANDKSAIGIVTLGGTGIAKVLAVSDGAAAVEPTDLSVSNESYPLTRRLYLYNAAKPTNLFVRRFVDYVSSPTGQATVEAAGYVALTVKAEATAVPDAASDRFRQLVAGATRLSFDLRFQPGSMELDSRGLRDLDRFVTYVRTQRINPGRIILAGFADNSGAAATNMVVSQRRAEVVGAVLNRSGVAVGKMMPFGSELPVADNATPEGRERNRRVEIYLAP